jgi:hypothetical protein
MPRSRRFSIYAVITAMIAMQPAAFAVATEHATRGAPAQPHFEYWVGAQAFEQSWSVYSGMTAAPFGSIQQDGLRLRFNAGYGQYDYSGPRATASGTETVIDFRGSFSFADALIGYHKQNGPLTLKLFAGFTTEGTSIEPFDAEANFEGSRYGAKAVAEAWWDLAPTSWASLDLAVSSLDRSYSSRGRLGWRVAPAVSIGIEAATFSREATNGRAARSRSRVAWPTTCCTRTPAMSAARSAR